jgi:hypothetical protein
LLPEWQEKLLLLVYDTKAFGCFFKHRQEEETGGKR